MYLKSVDGKILFEGRFTNIRQGVEMAVEDKCDLKNINLRQANLSGAHMDDAIMPEACFWGANLNGANMSEGNFEGADFRTANLLDTCLAESNCENVNFEGAYFSKTIMTQANLSKAQFSCPSLFSIDLASTQTMQGAIYSHLGEVDCDLSHAPLIIQGLPKPFIFMDDCTLIGGVHYKTAMRERVLAAILSETTEQEITVNQ
jgi:uncharacterized protein YjbI with pentapeptide repeats